MRLCKRALGVVSAGLFLLGCTQQAPNSFRLQQQLQSFNIAQEINTKVDMLWVVDNSASMDVSQDKLRKGFEGFAKKYLQPTWDIRVAVITTDTYLAHPVFLSYINSIIPGSIGWKSPYIQSRLSTFVNPSWNPTLVNLSTGAFTNGIRRKDQVPTWGPSYARLLPGMHDGPIAALCVETHPYFFMGKTQCQIRDDQTLYSGTSGCLHPTDGQTEITQCVNTVENDTVRSGSPILSTKQSQNVIDGFRINASVGSAGSGSERGFASLLQLLIDNETTDTAFFRKGAQRLIVFLSDEDDQSIVNPTPIPSGFSPYWGYQSTCQIKSVDGYQYRLSQCPKSDFLIGVAAVKDQLDSFFRQLDGLENGSPNYLVASIVPMSGASIQSLQQQRTFEDSAVGNDGDVSVDRGDRYLQLGELIGEGSVAMDIATDDYSPLLESMGRAVIEKKSRFTLERAPTAIDEMIVTIIHADGTQAIVPSEKIAIDGKILIITDLDFVLSLSSTDKILINYQPKTVY
jgi:hypothetical protein